jgi:crotonobetainyl-CoA:carnitine CoA-transferase CaiB-like acyl-CoA transferase
MKPLLSGVRILDLSQMLAGPYGSMLMADLGAEVIKVERPEGGDRTRAIGPYYADGKSAYFVSINRSKKSVALDLKEEADRRVFHELVKKSDVVFDNFRPGVLEKLGCDYETLRSINPGIISCSITAYGSTGPDKDRPAFDLCLQAYGGAMSITGEPGRPPVRLGLPMGDLAGGMMAAFAIASALYRREKTGEGCRIDLSLLDCLVSLLTYVAQFYFASGEVPGPIGSGHQSVVPYQAFRTKDGYVVVSVFTEKFWRKFCRVLGMEDLADDPRFSTNDRRSENRGELVPALEKEFLTKDAEEWLELLTAEGVPCAPVNTVDAVMEDPQVLARGMLVEVADPRLGPLQMLGNPVKVDGVEDAFSPAPRLGEHTREVLSELLGLSDDMLDAVEGGESG